MNYVPSFDIRDCIKELVTGLLNLEHISKIQVTETFIDGEIEMCTRVLCKRFHHHSLSETNYLKPILLFPYGNMF